MDTLQVLASKREERDYASRDIPRDVLLRIVQAGRVAGSARNRQPLRFTVLQGERPEGPSREAVSEVVTRPTNITGAAALVLVAGTHPGEWTLFDAGRAVQNMMLAAWDQGVGSCPNTVKDPGRLRELCGLGDDETPITIVSLGYPVRPRDPSARSFEEWVERIDRAPLDDVARLP